MGKRCSMDILSGRASWTHTFERKASLCLWVGKGVKSPGRTVYAWVGTTRRSPGAAGTYFRVGARGREDVSSGPLGRIPRRGSAARSPPEPLGRFPGRGPEGRWRGTVVVLGSVPDPAVCSDEGDRGAARTYSEAGSHCPPLPGGPRDSPRVLARTTPPAVDAITLVAAAGRGERGSGFPRHFRPSARPHALGTREVSARSGEEAGGSTQEPQPQRQPRGAPEERTSPPSEAMEVEALSDGGIIRPSNASLSPPSESKRIWPHTGQREPLSTCSGSAPAERGGEEFHVGDRGRAPPPPERQPILGC
ncbi:PREDICTED: basic salivary proline-rich protein 4-like [Vollenhovia emeryi]|uniref:basic salivary proline-rich protein 4-like n=1 Tax=Vollenhovia emeryi TaxID=411798 RepID=UPI0005F43715|nr:PREDICTED: basic salivary proline-rich protein 4-like [Vollenhovia emeryi]